jgi:hypothetical protein
LVKVEKSVEIKAPPGKVASLVCILIGVILIGTCSFWSYKEYISYMKIHNTEGVITNKWLAGYYDDGETSFSYYSYTLKFINEKTGKQVTYSFTYPYRFYEIGDQVQIYYDPDDPTTISVTHPSLSNRLNLSLPGLLFGSFFLVIGILTLRTGWHDPTGQLFPYI